MEVGVRVRPTATSLTSSSLHLVLLSLKEREVTVAESTRTYSVGVRALADLGILLEL